MFNRQMDRSKDQERLLSLIEEGDAFKILSEENMGESFNELMKYQLISFDHGRVFITELGKQAQREGVQIFLERLKHNDLVKTLPVEKKLRAKSFYLLSALVITFLIMIIFFLQQ